MLKFGSDVLLAALVVAVGLLWTLGGRDGASLVVAVVLFCLLWTLGGRDGTDAGGLGEFC